MRKKEFLTELKEHLMGLPEEDVKEILEDYEEHFKVGKKEKRTESEIAKALGEPKQIAREVRKELRESKEEFQLNASLVEFWVSLKKLSKNLWREFKIEVLNLAGWIENKWNSTFEKKGLKKKKIKKKIKKDVKKQKVHTSEKTARIILLTLFNAFFMIWFWVSIFSGIIGIMVSSWSVALSGFVSLLAIVFGLATPFSAPVNNLLLSGFFASLGLTALGVILSILSGKLCKYFFRFTKWYFKLNRRIIRGRK